MTRDSLIEQMLRIRAIETRIAQEYPKGKMRTPVHLSIGQEACAVGVCSALKPEDVCVSTHRSHAHYLAKGGNLNALIAELYGKSTGCSRGHGGSMHLVDRSAGFLGSTSIVGGTIPIGVGAAFSKRLRGEAGISVVFLGDAALEEGVFHESANFAALHRLPVLFVCEDNDYSCYTHESERRAFRISRLIHAYDIAYFACEDDVEDVREAAIDLREVAVEGIRPAFLHIHTYRDLEHCGPANDDALGYRDAAELAEWRSRDALKGLELKKFFPEIDAAFAAAEAAPWPENVGMYAD